MVFDPFDPLKRDVDRLLKGAKLPLGKASVAGSNESDAERELRRALDVVIADEAKAGNEYRDMARLARQVGREHWARILEDIARQEDSHYQKDLSIMLSLDPYYKGMTRVPRM